MSQSLLQAVAAYIACDEWLRNTKSGVIENVPNRVHYLNRWKRVSGMYRPLFQTIVESNDYALDIEHSDSKLNDPVKRSFLIDDIDTTSLNDEDIFLMRVCENLMYDEEVRAAVYRGTVEGPAERFMTEQTLLMTAFEVKYGKRPSIKLCWINPEGMVVPHVAEVYNAFVCEGFEDLYDGITAISDESYDIVTITDS